MYKHTTVKKSLILLVAMLLVVAVVLSACGPKAHKPVTIPNSTEDIDSNGGIAVRYGEWIYYVNGYQSSASAENTYVDTTNAPRIGSIVRIKADQVVEAVKRSEDEDKTSAVKTKEIAELVRENAEIVIPRIYYTANTTNTALNGLWIFDNRIYILTPNDQLTAGGNSQTSQMVLMSYNLGGGEEQRHYTFTSNSAQVWLYKQGTSLMATYVMSNELHVLTIGATEKDSNDTLVTTEGSETNTVSSVNFDRVYGSVFYLDANGSICKLEKGATEPTVLVKNDSKEGDTNTITYTIKSVCNGFVYYTKADTNNSSVNDVVLYYTDVAVTEDTASVALNTSDVSKLQGYKDGKVVIVRSRTDGYYGLYIVDKDTVNNPKCLLKPGYNKNDITINKIEGDLLYYTVNSVTYIKNLTEVENEGYDTKFGTTYAYGLTTGSTGWSTPDIVDIGGVSYMFTLSSNSVSVVKFNAEKKTNSSPATVLTLTAAEK